MVEIIETLYGMEGVSTDTAGNISIIETLYGMEGVSTDTAGNISITTCLPSRLKFNLLLSNIKEKKRSYRLNRKGLGMDLEAISFKG